MLLNGLIICGLVTGYGRSGPLFLRRLFPCFVAGTMFHNGGWIVLVSWAETWVDCKPGCSGLEVLASRRTIIGWSGALASSRTGKGTSPVGGSVEGSSVGGGGMTVIVCTVPAVATKVRGAFFPASLIRSVGAALLFVARWGQFFAIMSCARTHKTGPRLVF